MKVFRGMATGTTVRTRLHMPGLIPYRQVPLQLEIDRAMHALQAYSRPIDKFQVTLLSLTSLSPKIVLLNDVFI